MPSRHRERLLEGLAASIREKGLQGTQVSDIVRHARTSRRTFYECFPDKESCFVELVEAARAVVIDSVRKAVDPKASWQEQVDSAVDAYVEALQIDPAITVIVVRELPMLGERGLRLLRESVELYSELVVGLVVDDPDVGPVPVEVAVMLVGGILELVSRALDRGEDVAATAGVVKQVMKEALGSRWYS